MLGSPSVQGHQRFHVLILNVKKCGFSDESPISEFCPMEDVRMEDGVIVSEKSSAKLFSSNKSQSR